MGFGFMSRIKNWLGGKAATTITYTTSQTSLPVPDDAGGLVLSGTATIATLTADTSTRGGRLLWLYQAAGTTTLTNNGGSTTANQMDLGGGDATLGATDFIVLYLRIDGVWVRATAVADN